MTWPNGLQNRRLHLSGSARDLRTDDAGAPHVVDQVSLQAEVDRGDRSRLCHLEAEPDVPGIEGLLDQAVASGFRALVARHLAEQERARTALFQLLDELPIAALISGYAYQLDPEIGPQIRVLAPPRDLCAGWAGDATMMAALDAGQPLPLALGPIAPELTTPDEWSWHSLASLPRVSMRRRRRLDVWEGDDGWAVDAMFRDSWVGPDGVETVVHEYAATAQIDPGTHTVLTIEAAPKVLPWPECPAAAASAQRLIGASVDDLRTRVRTDFIGTSTCTHLNDMLRSFADVPVLAEHL